MAVDSVFRTASSTSTAPVSGLPMTCTAPKISELKTALQTKTALLLRN